MRLAHPHQEYDFLRSAFTFSAEMHSFRPPSLPVHLAEEMEERKIEKLFLIVVILRFR